MILYAFKSNICCFFSLLLGSGATPLHSAASGAHLQSVSCLIKHGAVTDAQTASGDLPLDFAKRTGNPNSYLKAGTTYPVLTNAGVFYYN